MPSETALEADVNALREFNRFYTRRIGLLNEGHLDSGFSLAEVRVLFELDRVGGLTAKALGETLDLDAGYLSRILKRFEFAGLLARRADPQDGRSSTLSLTSQGHAAFQPLNARSQAQIGALLAPLGQGGRRRLSGAVETIRALLEAPPADTAPITLRPHRVGDMGWVTRRHALLYAAEYGWDERFEALVAGICADFIRDFDPARERCWIAERAGEPLGSIFLVKSDAAGVAKLRLLLLEPSARGLGLGRRLVETCVGFARDAGYGEVTLWTQSILTAARGVYRGAGFEMVESQAHNMFGAELVGETWGVRL